MKKTIQILLVFLFILAPALVAGCSNERTQTAESEEPEVLEEGSTADQPEYYVNEDGEVVYLDSHEQAEDESAAEENLTEEQNLIEAIPVFPGAQRIHPAGENPELRQSYITRAHIEAVERFYHDFLAYGAFEPGEEIGEPENMVNSITSVENNRRQTTLFVNPDGSERGAMKVLLKEFPAQHAVQIVLTTLYATPSGLEPVGTYVTPEEVEDWVEQSEAEDSSTDNSDDTASGEGD